MALKADLWGYKLHQPTCVASTAPEQACITGLYHSAHWTADGTTVIAHTDNQTISTYVLPPDLLESEDRVLSPSSFVNVTNNLRAYVTHPNFGLSNPDSTLLLSAEASKPIKLHNLIYDKDTYEGVQGETKDVTNNTVNSFALPGTDFDSPESARCLLFTSPRHFVAGFKNKIALYDLEQNSPMRVYQTAPARKYRKGHPPKGPVGLMSAFAMAQESYGPDGLNKTRAQDVGLLAAGTLEGEIGLFPPMGFDNCVARFSTKAVTNSIANEGTRGVSALAFSPNAKYLYVALRNTDYTLIYDIRKTRELLGWCTGRRALGIQRLGIEVVQVNHDYGHDLVAGGSDGYVRVWRSPHLQSGAISPVYEWKLHGDAVSSAVVHPLGEVMTTASGSWSVGPVHTSVGREDPSSNSSSSSSSSGESSDSSDSSKSADDDDASSATLVSDYNLKIWSF